MTTVGFYVKAGTSTGYGHLVRCFALAQELTKRGCECVFWTNQPAWLRDRGYDAFYLNGGGGLTPDVWIVDLEGGCPPALAKKLRYSCDKFVILNGVGYPDGGTGRMYADLVFYQGVTMRPYNELDWTGFRGRWFAGVEWLILRREFSQVKAKPGSHDPPRVVISGGGSDPKNVTGKVLNALGDREMDLRAIIGPSANSIYYDKHIRFDKVLSPPNMAGALAWADVAVVSYGMTAFECLALGLPTVALSISEDHARSANLAQFGSNSALISLGQVEGVHSSTIRDAVYRQMRTPVHTSRLASRFVDGKGATRVADKIMEAINGMGMGERSLAM